MQHATAIRLFGRGMFGRTRQETFSEANLSRVEMYLGGLSDQNPLRLIRKGQEVGEARYGPEASLAVLDTGDN